MSVTMMVKQQNIDSPKILNHFESLTLQVIRVDSLSQNGSLDQNPPSVKREFEFSPLGERQANMPQ